MYPRSNDDDAQSIVGENLRTPLVELLVNQEGLLNPQDATEAGQNESLFHIGSATIKELLKSTQKRDLGNWCLREKLTKDQFIQRAFELLFEFPYVEVFKQRRNNGELVVLHKNVDCRLPSSYNSQSSWMHTSDLGFRAYLHTISDKIASWTKEQEAFYQATLLSNEIKMATQETIETPKSASTQKGQKVRTKTKTNKKGRNSISKGEAPLETVAEKEIFDENGEYIVKGSLKDELRKKVIPVSCKAHLFSSAVEII
ncbi:unnamed protein product [Dibothriocephalus latus]|uniref:Uncharacterized protein n=1 Tax=Dibothriocephalus latus TaxID=60516 RepID=A0A3P7LJ18_DIBLA|nr:unnamed protein product [Dibothriocephalus latus]